LYARATAEPERTADRSDDELAARLTRLAPQLDEEARSSLLFALFPVPDAIQLRSSTFVLQQAIISAKRDGVLGTRAGAFLRERPDIAERLRRPIGTRGRRFLEIGAWIAAAALVSVVGLAFLARSNPSVLRWHPRVALVPAVTPVAPPFDVRTARRRAAHKKPPVNPAPAPPSAPVHTVAALHPVAVDPGRVAAAPAVAHPVDYTPYFAASRHFWKATAAATPVPPSRPTASPSPEPTPRVHSLFGRWFGPRGF
jgi:hypothetical protein